MRLLGLLLLLAAAPAAAQVADTTLGLPDGHTPRGALRRAAAVPGWGQIYNRQYLKLPLVYGGLAAFAGGVVYMHREKVFYSRAYGFRFCELDLERLAPDPDCVADPRLRFEPEYEDLLDRVFSEEAVDPELDPGSIRDIRDNRRRNRDLLFIGGGLFYALTVLDAYVSAHLMHFDVGEDLTLRASPTGRGGAQATLTLRF